MKKLFSLTVAEAPQCTFHQNLVERFWKAGQRPTPTQREELIKTAGFDKAKRVFVLDGALCLIMTEDNSEHVYEL